jgi:hypothetical protein
MISKVYSSFYLPKAGKTLLVGNFQQARDEKQPKQAKTEN